MEKLLRDKFRRDPELRERLVQTGSRELINLLPSDARFGGGAETNSEKRFWGTIAGNGSSATTAGDNNFGKLL